jgi:Glutaredoxin-like domain (DUF836)
MERIRQLFRRREQAPIRVVLYSRPGCHLCEDTRELLGRIAQRRPLDINVIDITSDPELVRRYDLFIPVVRVGESVELSAPIDEAALRHAVDEAAVTS